jgi:lipid II:glycine glycyltransferase (peptidoglycan interpeptide bridge formation enzyme)
MLFKVSEVWFGYKFSLPDMLWLTAWQHVKQNKRRIYGVRQPSHTIENNLSLTADALFTGYGKTVQVEIKQAEKAGVTCFFKQDIDAFVRFYNAFARHRDIDDTSVERLQRMEHCLCLSFAMKESQILAAHSYIIDKQSGVVRLMQSASLRLKEGADKQLTGRANKLLHYFDMLYFKKEGFTIYDFGGYAMDTTDPGLQGINRFKLSFGGAVTVCYNYWSYPYYVIKKIAARVGLLGRT